MTTAKKEKTMRLMRAEFEREWGSDFATLRKIPSTNARKFLDYFCGLDEGGKQALANSLVLKAFSDLFPDHSPHPYQAGNVAYKQYIDALPLMWDWRYDDVRILRSKLAVARLEPESSIGRSMTNDIRKWIENMTPVKSTEIRKLVRLAFSQIFTPLVISHDEQYWLYEGNLRGKPVSVTVDYAHKYHQLEYSVSIRKQDGGRLGKGLSYERLLGLSFAHWDCLEQANLDQSIALLKEHVEYCAAFLELIGNQA